MSIVEVGDWVRWGRAGQLVMGEVRYVLRETPHGSGWLLWTDNGTVAEKDVLEVRKAVAP